MKIGFFGDGPWAQRALPLIHELPGVETEFVAARFAAPDSSLREQAESLGIPFLAHRDVNAHEFLATLDSYGLDLLVSMSFDQIFGAGALEATPLGIINCHAGALPFYRGRNPLNWALINGENRFGVTVHHVDSGIDTGDIILQRFADIAVDDTYRTVLEKAYTLCADTLCDALRAMADGTATRIPQSSIDPVGFYCGRRRPGDEWIDWSWGSSRVHDFVRAISSPGPCARARTGDRIIALVQSELIEDAPAYIGTPGEIVGRDAAGVIVKTGDSTVRLVAVAELKDDGTKGKTMTPRFAIGTRFETVSRQSLRAGVR